MPHALPAPAPLIAEEGLELVPSEMAPPDGAARPGVGDGEGEVPHPMEEEGCE